jgi:hypothetical protein
MADATLRVEGQFSVGVWTTMSDVVMADGLRWRRGMTGGGPLDRIATTGTFEFTLRNDAANSGSLEGYYSPGHTNVRSGWDIGTPVRVVANYSSSDYSLWQGRVRTIRPSPGVHLGRRVSVTAHDCMGDLADSIVREISPQFNKTEVELLQALINALPADAQPTSLDADVSLDSYPYAFDNAGDGVSALALASDVVFSAAGYLFSTGAGALKYANRLHWEYNAIRSTFYLTEAHIAEDGLDAPTSRDRVYNVIRATAHPRVVDDTSDTVLWSADSILSVAPSQTITVWGAYRDPDTTNQLIGASDVQPAPIANTDYMANASPTGLSTDLTADVDVAVTGFASTAKVVITNNAAVTAYLVNTSGEPFLTIKGRGVYDIGPITAESSTAAVYSDRTLRFDLPYQDDGNIAQGVADFIGNLYGSTERWAQSVTFYPQLSTDNMIFATSGEIGTRAHITDSITAFVEQKHMVIGIEFEVLPSRLMVCRWTLAPTIAQDFFILDTSTLDGADTLGYA